MNETEVADFREKLASLIATGTEAQVRAYLDENFTRLPENIQYEITASLFTSALEDEAREIEIIGKIHDEGLEAADTLEQIKTELESGEMSTEES